jgi:hypothetical protein
MNCPYHAIESDRPDDGQLVASFSLVGTSYMGEEHLQASKSKGSGTHPGRYGGTGWTTGDAKANEGTESKNEPKANEGNRKQTNANEGTESKRSG